MNVDTVNCESHINPDQSLLFVERSSEDYAATERAFRKSGLANPLYHCAGGNEALDYLFCRGEFEDPEKAPRPAVILVDLDLPESDGYAVLKAIKRDEILKRIPVIALTSSSDGRDIERCCEAGADAFLRKPVRLDSLMEAFRRLTDHWFLIAVVPRPEDQRQ